jgi:predicted nuclease of predicted toxin-antitoxin system
MDKKVAYRDFTQRLKLLISKNPQLITLTLSNIFTMRLVGNKTHGDLAEIAIAEFINHYMYDFKSIHVGKDLFRAKQSEEDIQIVNEVTKAEFSISLKAYGDGPLQLSTDKQSLMFSLLRQTGTRITGEKAIAKIMDDPVFNTFSNINVLPLIYNEKQLKCNILVFDYSRAREQVALIEYAEEGKGRKHPVYRFYTDKSQYICEVRYGGATANALQRGFWTHTKNAIPFFDSLTDGWVDYSLNPVLVKLFSHALLTTRKAHELVLEELKKDIEEQKLGVK